MCEATIINKILKQVLKLSQAAICDGIMYSMKTGNTAQEAQRNFLPLFQD